MRLTKMHTHAIADAFMATLETQLPNDDEGNDEKNIFVSGFRNYKVSGYHLLSHDNAWACTVFGDSVDGDMLRVTFGKSSDYTDSGWHRPDPGVDYRDYQLTDIIDACKHVVDWLSQ
jgi:hypothetical protein